MKTIMDLFIGDSHIGQLTFTGKDIWVHSRLAAHEPEVQKAMSKATVALLEGLKPLWEKSASEVKRG